MQKCRERRFHFNPCGTIFFQPRHKLIRTHYIFSEKPIKVYCNCNILFKHSREVYAASQNLFCAGRQLFLPPSDLLSAHKKDRNVRCSLSQYISRQQPLAAEHPGMPTSVLSQAHQASGIALLALSSKRFSIFTVALMAASVWSASRPRVRNTFSPNRHVMTACTSASVRPPGGMVT